MMRSGAGHYIGWLGHRNLGDEAMFQICRQRFPRIAWAHWSPARRPPSFLGTIARWKPANLQQRLTHRWARSFSGEVGLLGGGTLINQGDWLRDYRGLRERLGEPVPVFGTGVAARKFYASQPGWVDRRAEWVELFKELPIVGVRGPASYRELQDAGARNIFVCGDPALLSCVLHRRGSRRRAPSGHVGINAGRVPQSSWAGAEAVLPDFTRHLIARGLRVSIISVCSDDDAACHRLANEAGLQRRDVIAVHKSYGVFMRRAQDLDLIVSVKLHAAVLAAAAGVPMMVLEYLPKCADFAESIDWGQFVLRTTCLEQDAMTEMLFSMLDDLSTLRARLDEGVASLSRRFDTYCSVLERWWDGQSLDPFLGTLTEE